MSTLTGGNVVQEIEGQFTTQFEAASDFAISSVFGLMALLALATIVRVVISQLSRR
jgi:hypothetical protein